MTIPGAAALAVAVVAAAGIGVKDETACQILRHGGICTAGKAAEKLDACLGEGVLCPCADAAAEDDVHTVLHQKTGKGTVALPVGGNDGSILEQAVFNGIDLELLGAAEVLEHQTIFIRDCDLHKWVSFLVYPLRFFCQMRYRPSVIRVSR